MPSLKPLAPSKQLLTLPRLPVIAPPLKRTPASSARADRFVAADAKPTPPSRPIAAPPVSRPDPLLQVKEPEAPSFTGTIEREGAQIRLRTAERTFDLAVPKENVWLSRWAAEAGAFMGRVVTVRGWPDATGTALAVDGFAPGEGDSVQGRVTLTESGAVAIQVRPGKLVEIENAELAARLRDYVRVGFILPGSEENGKYRGNPDGYYMLTKLNPSTDDGGQVRYDADTPFEKTLIATPGEFPDEKLGERIFVYGHVPAKDEELGVHPPAERVRRFVASWVSEPIHAEWQKAAEARGAALEVHREAGVSGAGGVRGSFAPDSQLQAGPAATRESVVRDGVMERSVGGVKLEAGPVDAAGLPHGEWAELAHDGSVSVKGRYEHGARQGLWIQYREGKSANAWQYEAGRLVAAGHVDEQSRQHGAWTMVAADGRYDGGEATFNHGLRAEDWWYYRPGTSEYARAEYYDENGKLKFEGAVRSAQVGGQQYELRTGEWKFYGADGKLTGTKTYGPSDSVDANGEQRKP